MAPTGEEEGALGRVGGEGTGRRRTGGPGREDQSGRGDHRDGAEGGDVVRRASDSVNHWGRETVVGSS